MKSDRIFSGLLLLACVGLGTLVLLLSRQNQALRAELAGQHRLTPLAPLQPGDRMVLADLFADPDGSKGDTSPRVTERRSLVLVFAYGCSPCEATMPVWREMLDECPPSRLRVIGLSMQDSDRGSEDAAGSLPFEVHSPVEPQRRELLRRLPRLPASILLNEDGIIEEVWYGELSTDDQHALGDEICAAG